MHGADIIYQRVAYNQRQCTSGRHEEEDIGEMEFVLVKVYAGKHASSNKDQG